jgi:hypothetical protein
VETGNLIIDETIYVCIEREDPKSYNHWVGGRNSSFMEVLKKM